MKYSVQHLLVLVVFLLMSNTVAFSQHTQTDQTDIQKGTILTSFNVDFSASEKEEQNNQVHSFDVGAFNMDALYFLNKNIGIGPIVGLRYANQFTNYKLGPDKVNSRNWNVEYGAKAGYYTPFNSLFSSDALGDTQVFITSGVSWVRNITKFESSSPSGTQTYKRDPQFRYQLGVGMYVPFGERIGMEWKLQRESWKEDYSQYGFSNDNWSSTWVLGLGLKVKF